MTDSHAPASPLLQRLKTAARHYPWDAVILSMMLVLLIVILGSFAVDAIWTTYFNNSGYPQYNAMRGTCYWIGDNRTLVRIAANGYTDYDAVSGTRHLTNLPDRSWWPVFVNLTALALRLTGGNPCSGWFVNVAAMTLLPVVIQGITKTRRPLLMTGIALMPYGAWLYTGMAEGVFLLVSGLLLWAALRAPSPGRWANFVWGAVGLLLGVLVGLTKPNALALVPGFGVLALTRTITYLRAATSRDSAPHDWRTWLRHALADHNPGWTALLGAVGIVIGMGWWFYQTSGYYPLYVMMAQRTLWYKQFDRGNVLAFFNYIMSGWWNLVHGHGLPAPTPSAMIHFSAVVLLVTMAVRDLPPRWPGQNTRRTTPIYVVASLIAVFFTMLSTGQAHAIQRYLIGNIFFAITLLRYIYGDEDEPSLSALPGIIRRREAGTFRALLRLTLFACCLLLLVVEAIMVAIYSNNV